MADDDATLAAEIARLEADLERARLESKLQHLKAELNAVEGVQNEEDYLVIHEAETDDDYTEQSYEEYDLEEDYVEEEIIEEYYAEEELENENVPEQAPPRQVYDDLKGAHSNLRKAPVSAYQQKESTTVKEAPIAHIKPAVPKIQTRPVPEPVKANAEPRVKAPVRPPPGQGGKPVPREDPEVPSKQMKKNPLSRLLQFSKKSVEVLPEKSSSATSVNPTSVAPKKIVPTKPDEASLSNQTKKPISKKATPTSGSPFQRRVIPNIQPSPAGEESIFEQLLGQKLITNPQLHKCSTKGCVKNQELVGLYFGAVWKSDCKRFNSVLKDFYFNAAQANNLEIIYISADRSLIEFKDCYSSMPFLAMPAGTTSIKNELTKALKIIEMPALVILDDEGSIVTVQGAQKVMELEKGNVEQANQLVDRWKKTRPIPISDVKMDNTLLHGTMERGTVYWQN